MSEQDRPISGSGQDAPPDVLVEEEVEPSISGTGCLVVIAASFVVAAVLYWGFMARNPETEGPAYMAASLLFGFFVVGIIWGVIQQQRESDAARAAEEDDPEPDDDSDR